MSIAPYAIQLILLMASSILAAYFLSGVIAKLVWPDHGSKLLGVVDAAPRFLLGSAYTESMDWRKYLISLILLNAAVFALDVALLALQPALGGQRLSPDLIFNIASSFVTNTNLQHYEGRMLTVYSQMLVITYTMFVAPASGLAASLAFMRGFTRRTDSLGNFYADFARSVILVLLPISFASAVLLILMGVPQTLQPQAVIRTLQGPSVLRLGPVASLESIKLLGNNGGGYYSANSASPLENPSELSNLYESFLMLLLPLSIPLAFGRVAGMRRGASILGAMLAGMGILMGMSLLGGAASVGVEPRLGDFGTLVFNTVSMATDTGATASSLFAMSPLAVSSFLMAMFIQAVPGAVGVGFMYMMVFVIITLFILGLMVGKTPEIMGMKISPRDVKLSTAAFLVHPLVILVPLVLAFALGQAQHLLGAPDPLHFTEVLYEFTSAAANNGSDYLGAAANTPFWNYLTGAVMLVGRYVPLALMMALAGSFAAKDRRRVPEPVETQGVLFAVLLLAMTLLLTVLTFFPFIVLGPFSM